MEAVDANGHAITDAMLFAWTSTDETVAAVDRTGLVTAVGSGSARVTAVSGAVSAATALTVAQEIKGVRITPATDTLRAPGETVRLLAQPADANGFPVADAGFVFAWSSSDESVATVDDGGLVTAVAEGTVEITALSVDSDYSGVTDVVVWFPSDRDILVVLYNATNGPFWLRNENWLSDASLDSWYGVETDADGRVVTLALSNRHWANRLHGSIPVELGYLSELRELNLPRNQLTGAIPPELGRLANLKSLELFDNNLTGGIPAQLGDLSSLEELNLSWNALAGAIPAELGRLINLKAVDLSENRLSGRIPPSFEDLKTIANAEPL